MTQRNPLFYDSATGTHRPLDSGDQILPGQTPISAVQGNKIVANSDGLYFGNYMGTTFYVDSVAGIDTNAGSKAAPFKTLDRALAVTNGLFPGGIYGGQSITIALKAGQSYPMANDFNVPRGSDISISFYGDPNYGDFNSGAVAGTTNPWIMADLQRPVIQPQIGQVATLWKIAGFNMQGGAVTLQGVTVQLPGAPSNPSKSVYSQFSDFIRGTQFQSLVSTTGVIFNMTDLNAYWGAIGTTARSYLNFTEFATQFQVQNQLLTSTSGASTAALTQRQYFIKFYPDFAGNNQQAAFLVGTSVNSSAGSGFINCCWSNTEALVVTGSKTSLQTFPATFDPGYGLSNYLSGVTRSAGGAYLNFLCSQIIS